MTNPQRITTLLAAVAVLLAFNIAVSLNRQAEAQQVQVAPHVVGIAIWHKPNYSTHRVYRAWSDGFVEYNIKTSSVAAWAGWVPVPEECQTPSPACVE